MTTPAGYSLAPNGFYYYTDGSGPYNVDTAGNATLIGSGTSSGGGGTTPPAGNPEVAKISKLISGGGVAWISGLTLRVAAATYYIQGILYSSAQTDVVLSTADGSNPRIDSIVLNTSSVADKVTGTPATPATKPEVNPETQLEVSFAYVDTSATVVLGSAATVNIYNNDAEWTSAVSANVNAGSTSSPINGTKSILYTTPAVGNYSRFTGSADVDLSDSTNLVFTFKNTAQWASAARLNIGFYTNGGALRGNLVSFKPGDYGSSASSTSAQQIVIPLSNFAANGLAVRRIQLTIGGLAPATSFRIDDIMLQYVGTATIDDTKLHYEGAWNASKLYALNSIATYVGGLFVAIRANTNANPLTATSDWKPLHTKVIQFSCSDLTTALAAGTGKAVFRMPYAMTVTDARASLATAQASGSIFTVDVNDSGTTILSTKLTIDNTEKTSTTAATPKVISDSALVDDAEITVDIDQIGDGTAKGLVVTLIGY